MPQIIWAHFVCPNDLPPLTSFWAKHPNKILSPNTNSYKINVRQTSKNLKLIESLRFLTKRI